MALVLRLSQCHLSKVWLHWLIAMQRPFLAHSRLYPLLERARHPINSQQRQCFWLRGSVAASPLYSLLLFFNLSTCADCPALFSSFIKALLWSLCGLCTKKIWTELSWKTFQTSSTRLHQLWIEFLSVLASTWQLEDKKKEVGCD